METYSSLYPCYRSKCSWVNILDCLFVLVYEIYSAPAQIQIVEKGGYKCCVIMCIAIIFRSLSSSYIFLVFIGSQVETMYASVQT